jgi:predicted esterase
MRAVTVSLLLLVLAPALAQEKPAAGLSAAEKKEAEELLKQYFEAKGWDEKQKVAEKLAAIDHPSKADIQAFSRKCFAYARRGTLIEGKSPQKCTHPDYPGSYIINGTGFARKGPVGLFISLHGGGAGVGDGGQIAGLFGTPGQSMINVYPTVCQKTDTAWNTEREEQYVLAIIDELKRTYTIDTNRVYLAGHSMGGFGTWSIGGRHADLFAAISPMAGGVFAMVNNGQVTGLTGGVVFNLKNLPIWFYHSTDDAQVSSKSDEKAAEVLAKLKEKYGPYDYVWKLYNDCGHGLPKDGVKPIFDWMLAKRRDPLPKRVLWEPSRSYKKHFYWIRKTSTGGQVDVQRDGNKFTVTGSSGGITIMLNEKMVKLDQEITVVDDKGAELFKGKAPYSLVAMVESIDAKKDPEMWFPAWIELK